MSTLVISKTPIKTLSTEYNILSNGYTAYAQVISTVIPFCSQDQHAAAVHVAVEPLLSAALSSSHVEYAAFGHAAVEHRLSCDGVKGH